MKGKFNFPKRLFATVLSAVMAFSTVPVIGTETAQAAVNTLNGVSETHWARKSIEKMVNQNILSGDSEGNLHPDRPVTRAEYVAMINRAFGYNSYVGVTLPFKDIEGTEWYADHIRIAYQQGYFSGIDKNTAGATNPITREEAAAMICRNLKIASTTPQIDAFADGKEVSQWSKEAVGAAVEKGFIHGYTDGSFRPKALISRAEAATMFSNAMGTIYDRSGTYGQGMIEGNVTISTSNLELSDVVITGDLYITEGVGTGYVNLKNVSVLGEVIVCGGGEGNFGGNSVTLDDCTIWKLTVDGSDERPVSLYAKGNTNIPETNIKSITYLQNHPDTDVGFDNIEVKGPEETTLYLSGTFQNVAAINPKNKVVLGKGKIENLTVDEDAKEAEVTLDRNVVVENMNLDGNGKVTGRGDIENLIVTTEDTSVETLPENIEIRPGVTSNIGGKEMTSLDATESSSAPKITSGYPRAEEITSSAAKVYFETNKPGTIRWALTYDDAEELDEDEILKPTTITRIQKHGSLNATESEKEFQISLSGLEANATYILYAVLVDERGDVSRIKEEEIETADKTQPGFVSGYPRTVPTDSHSFEIEAMVTKDGFLYWAVYKKGAAAPTAYQLRSQNLDGTICHGQKKNVEKNIEYGEPDLLVSHENLTEKETYDVYVMTSDGEKDSKIVKLSATTKDTTPPEFNPDELIAGKNEERAVSVIVGANEDATVYYVVTEWGETFPVTVPPALEPPALASPEAVKQVYNANNVFKSGKANVKENEEITVKISGLQQETPYHVYMILQDKAGNFSTEVKKIDVKTRDVNPPKAKVDFENSIDGKADVEENIMIVFDEIVCYNTPSVLLKDVGVKEGDTETEIAGKISMLEKIFTLVDVSSVEEELVTIYYDKITFEEGPNGATIVVFPPAAFETDSGIGLNSGSNYKFILNHVMDTTGNEMEKDTELEVFRTSPPLVILTQTNSPFDTKYKDMDYAFSVKPEAQKTSDRVLFDMIFETDTMIKFELYQWIKGKVNPDTGTSDSPTETGYWKQINHLENDSALDKNRGTTLHQILDLEVKDATDADYTGRLLFEQFNELKEEEYAVKIVQIGSDDLRGGWNAVVNMDVKCIAGQYDDMGAMVTIATQNTNPNYSSILKGGKVSMVNQSNQNIADPSEFIMKMTFSDTIIPKFLDGYPRLEKTGDDEKNIMIGDTFIAPQLMTDRFATMYYLIAPKGNILLDWETNDTGEKVKPKQESLDSYAYQIMNNSLKVTGSFWGAYNIESGAALYQPQFPTDGELMPGGEKYEMFSVLKGTPATPSKVYYTPFETQPIAPPKLEALVLNKTETSAELVIASDKYAYVEWLIMSRDRAKQYVDFSTNQVIATQEGNLKTLIRNGAEGEDKKTYLDYGKGYAKWNKDMNRYELPYTADLAVAAAKDNRYVLVAFGQMCLQDNKNTPVGSDSAIVVSEPFERKDTKPPKIEDIYKDKRITTDLESYSYSKDSAGDSYDGTLEIIFTEPLFYKEDDKAQPLQLSGTAATDKKEFLQKLFATQLDDYSLFTDDEKKEKFYIDYDKLLKVSTETVEIKEEKVVDGEMTTVVSKVQAVNGVKLRFDNAEDGEILRLNTKLCDADDNMMQSYYLIFEDMEYVPQKEEPTSEADPTGEQRLRMRRKASSWYFDELSET